MIAPIIWYLLFSFLGLISFPLAYSLLPGLAGRGYAFARILGFLLWGFLFWLLGILGLIQNNTGGILFSLAIVTGVSIFGLMRIPYNDLTAWWRAHRRMVLVVEVLFAVAFAFMTWIRALNPEITATEKPMELAFINAILQSPSFPPADPWLSGYAISYYYFGYVLVAMVAMLTGTSAGISFNLGISLVFALGALGAYGVLYGLLGREEEETDTGSGSFAALFAPLFILLISNLEGFLDMLHARGLFWRTLPNGEVVSSFWHWLNLKDLVNAPAQPYSWMPQRFLWWWRASRVVNDVGFNGSQQEVIDEFPFFSFLLSDLHPHVLAIPFVLLAIGLAANHYFRQEHGAFTIFRRRIDLAPEEFAFTAIVMGALAFLNTWDFPIYVALFTGAYILRHVRETGWGIDPVLDGGIMGALLGIAGILFYLPFYFGFSSQAGGILPNVLNPTRGAHLWVMFGSLFVPLILYLLFISRPGRPDWRKGLLWGFGVVGGLWLLSLLAVAVVALRPEILVQVLESIGAPGGMAVLREAFVRRIIGLGGWLTLALMLSFVVALIARSDRPRDETFILLISGIGLLLIITPEYFYLRDLFSTRMNTIFKLYYQAWILMGLAAAYGTACILKKWRGPAGAVSSGLILIVMIMALTYPALSLQTKTGGFKSPGSLTLDGTLHGAYLTEDDRAAVNWLLASPRGTILEAVGGSYSSAARIATHTGYPNVLGWVFHQGQWRGGYAEVGSREGDIASIYETGSWEDARSLLDLYEVHYIYVGTLERTAYRVNEAKFRRNLPVVFEQGSVTIYGLP